MTVPVISPVPPAPVRNDAPADYSTKADTFAAAMPVLASDINDAVSFINEQVTTAIELSEANLEAAASGFGNRMYDTAAEMNADLSPVNGLSAIVMSDPDSAKNGWYYKSGASGAGSWVRLTDQPITESSDRLLGDGFGEKLLVSVTDSVGRRTWLEAESEKGGPTERSKKLMRGALDEVGFGENLLVAITDSEKRRTWLEATKSNGGPSDYSERKIRAAIGLEKHGRTGYLLALADSAGRLTDLTLRESDGQFADFVIERLARRLNISVASDRYLSDDGDLLPINTTMTKWAGYGSSTMYEWAGDIASIAEDFGASYYNGANGAVRISQTFSQMGVTPALFAPSGGEIPASGSVSGTSSNVEPLDAFIPTPGALAGVYGTLSVTGATWQFTRASSGSAVVITGEAEFIPEEGPKHRADVTLYNLGKNDINDGVAIESILSDHALAIEWLTPFSKRVVLLTHFGQTGRVAGDAYMTRIDAVNNFMKLKYGDNVFDLQAYLCGADVWVDTGLTPTADDLANQANGALAPSLGRDVSHMNPTARAAAAIKLKNFITAKEWY